MSDQPKKALGRILLEQRAISQADLDRVLAQQRPGQAPLATRLIQEGLVSELEALKALSAQRGVPGIDLNQVCILLEHLGTIPRDIALVHKLLPVLERPDRVFLAMANPEDRKVLEELEFVTGKRVFAYIALEGQLLRTIRDAYDARDRGDSHYVATGCPAEVIARAGLDPSLYKTAEAAPPPAPAAAARLGAAREEEVHDTRPHTRELTLPKKPPPSPPRAEAKAAAPREAAFRAEPANTETAMFRPSGSAFPAVKHPVVVDEKMQRAVSAEVAEADFGDVAEELSVVTELPRQSSRPPPRGEKKKVLVVDDEPDIRRMIRKILQERGHEVVEADRGKLALQMVKLEAPDLVILDAMLPEVHGFDIAKRIRGSSRYGHIPIVMVSAVYRGWRIAQDAKQSYGVDAFLEKPFKVNDLIALVERSFEARKPEVDPEVMSAEAERLLKEGVAAYHAGDITRAAELLEGGVKIDPLAYRLRFHLGLLYGKRGQIYDAIEQLERAVQIQSHHFASIKNLAILYQQAGFRNKAVEAWERALNVAPDEATKRTIKEHIVSLL
ncbi:MAG: response regulator [Polyangiaceae bacterium]|nr:response regulator [Polyangiaceae bacterium]